MWHTTAGSCSLLLQEPELKKGPDLNQQFSFRTGCNVVAETHTYYSILLLRSLFTIIEHTVLGIFWCTYHGEQAGQTVQCGTYQSQCEQYIELLHWFLPFPSAQVSILHWQWPYCLLGAISKTPPCSAWLEKSLDIWPLGNGKEVAWRERGELQRMSISGFKVKISFSEVIL